MEFTSPHMSPIVTVQLPYLEILKQLEELAWFLSSKGLVEGWDTIPVTIGEKSTSWNELIRVDHITIVLVLVLKSNSPVEPRCTIE